MLRLQNGECQNNSNTSIHTKSDGSFLACGFSAVTLIKQMFQNNHDLRHTSFTGEHFGSATVTSQLTTTSRSVAAPLCGSITVSWFVTVKMENCQFKLSVLVWLLSFVLWLLFSFLTSSFWHQVIYCGQACQKLHWFTHKKVCKILQEQREKQEAESAKLRMQQSKGTSSI